MDPAPPEPAVSPQLLTAALAAADTPMAIADARAPDYPLVWVNTAFAATSGYPVEQIIGRNARFLQGPGTDPATVARLHRAVRAGDRVRVRLRNYRPDGSTWWNEMHLSPVRDDAGTLTHVLGVQHDVTAQVAAENRYAHAASHDPLTGLLTRIPFLSHLDHELHRARRDRRALAVLFLDLDRFKTVNDTWGHAAGDALLRGVADRLRNRLRAADLLARFGGDEFVLAAVDLTGDGAKAAARVRADLTAALADPVTHGGTAHRVTLSTGLALFPRDATTAAALIAAADTAKYRAKAR